MPWNDINDMPEYTHKYSKVIRKQMMYVFNSTYKKVFKETKKVKEAEKRAMMAMHSVLKKRFIGNKSLEKNTRNDYFNHLIDFWLGNLNG